MATEVGVATRRLSLLAARPDPTVEITVTSLACVVAFAVYASGPVDPPVRYRCEPFDPGSEHCASLNPRLDGEPWPAQSRWRAARQAMLCEDPSLVTQGQQGAGLSGDEIVALTRELKARMNQVPPPEQCESVRVLQQARQEWLKLERTRARLLRENVRADAEVVPAPSTSWYWWPAWLLIAACGLVIPAVWTRRILLTGRVHAELGETLLFEGHHHALDAIESLELTGGRLVLTLKNGRVEESERVKLRDQPAVVGFCDAVFEAARDARSR